MNAYVMRRLTKNVSESTVVSVLLADRIIQMKKIPCLSCAF